jgi:hypothetical protein
MKQNLEDIVLRALEKFKLARQDDFILYGIVLQNLGVNLNRPIKDLFLYHKEMRAPSFESVSRCRRKITETRQDLIDWSTAKIRKDEEEEFRAYSRKR